MKETKSKFECKNCHKIFYVRSSFVKYRKKIGKNPGTFCSTKCMGEFNCVKKHKVLCETCLQPLQRTKLQIEQSESGRFFCSKSCAAIYNNKHKTTGTRRSKLESYLEERLRSELPDLELICNGKCAIDSELDFYFPQLRLAIELNGFLHYEPIYGQDKLEQIQANDQQKFLTCHQAGIELCVVSCTEKYITKIIKERYWTTIRDLVTPLLGRAGNANVQAL